MIELTGAEAELWYLHHQCHLTDEYTPIVEAAAYAPENVAVLSAEDIYFLATAIRTAIKKDAHAHFRTFKGVFEETNYVACLKSMSDADLEAMRILIDYHQFGNQW